ncbi:MAG TPA: hypothetical protein VME43_28485 [Bryobacteraceae bacterium]|nr:hypothetical protein [Bryobacteraceae bacterium]
MTFEAGFADAERAATATTKAVAVLAAAARQFHKAATEGDILKMRKVSERLSTLVESTRQEIGNARSAWPFSPEEEEKYLKESFAAELLEVARKEGLQIQQRDEGLVVFPSILRVLPADRAARINRRKVQGIRPSRLAQVLKAIQARKPKASAEHFLEVLHRAYRLIAGAEYGKTVALSSIYDTLTLLPGSSATYDQTDFVRDLFLLDRSGVGKTKSGSTYSLPASTGTKSARGTYSFVAPDGETVTYYGIRFTEAQE